MATVVKWYFVALAIFGAYIQEHAHAQLLGYFRRCVLPHEVRARLWERYDQFCTDGRKLEWRRRTGRCICEPGYYRDEETKNCFEAKRCGQCDSSKHEKFNACLSDCQMVCGKPVIQQCDKPCSPGCECMRGYIRKYKNGPCVPIRSCPPKCPSYMNFVLERERCPRVCNEAREDTCSEANEGPGCVCKKGFVLRAIFGTIRTRTWCIHESMCIFPDEENEKKKNSDGGHGVKRGGSSRGSGRGNGNGDRGSKKGRLPWEDFVPKKNDGDLYTGTKGFPDFGGADLGKGRGSKPSDDWIIGAGKGHDMQQSDDWFKQHDIFSDWKQDQVDDSLSPTKVAEDWTPPAKGQTQGAIGRKGGSSRRKKASRKIPGVGFAPTDGLPDIGAEGGKGGSFGDWKADGGGDLAPSKITDDWHPGSKGSLKGGSTKGGSSSQSKGGGIPGAGFAPPDGLPDLGNGGYKGAQFDGETSSKKVSHGDWFPGQEKMFPMEAKGRAGRKDEDFDSRKVTDDFFPGRKRTPEFEGSVGEKTSKKGGTWYGPDASRASPSATSMQQTIQHTGNTKGGANADDSSGIGMGILNAGVNLGKRILGGLGSIASFGGLIDYSLPGLGKGKHSFGNLRDNHEVPGQRTRGQRLFSDDYASGDMNTDAGTKNIWWSRRRREVRTETEDMGSEQRESTRLENPLTNLLEGKKPQERSDIEAMVRGQHNDFNVLNYKDPVGGSPTEEQYVCDELSLIPKVLGFRYTSGNSTPPFKCERGGGGEGGAN